MLVRASSEWRGRHSSSEPVLPRKKKANVYFLTHPIRAQQVPKVISLVRPIGVNALRELNYNLNLFEKSAVPDDTYVSSINSVAQITRVEIYLYVYRALCVPTEGTVLPLVCQSRSQENTITGSFLHRPN